MPRLMSVAMTTDAVRRRQKTVTRRKGWWLDSRGKRIIKPGDHLTLCEKVQGRKPGEPLVRICEVEVVAVTREPLHRVGKPGELTREGFAELDYFDDESGVWEFWERYFEAQGIAIDDDVTRIEFRYLEDN